MKLPLAAAALASIAAPLHAGPADDARAQLRRIAALDDAGPRLDAVIAYDKRADRAAKAMTATGPLHGRTVLVKDNIETREWPTTAGSLALAGNATGRDAPLVANLRKAGGVVMGKTNLSEWANIRSNGSSSGWSAVGGLVRNPYATDRTACGSSSGSGAAVAAGFAWAAIGTETNGSITCPASVNGVVGFKPSVGIVSRTHVVPISSTQDTPGPMARTVGDAALLLTAIAGADPADPATAAAPAGIDYTVGIDTASLSGVRIGVMRGQIGPRADVRALFEAALDDMRRAGAVLVDVDFQPDPAMSRDSFQVLLFELRDEMGRYLRTLPGADMPRSLADLIAFNAAHPREEMRWFGQEIFEQADKTVDRPAYEKARANAVRLAGKEGIDRLLTRHDVRFLIAPTRGPAWTTDLVNGDNFGGGIGFGSPPAIAGYPHLTVPMGAVEGLPVGISLIGAKWDDAAVLRAGAAYERARSAVLVVPGFKPWSPAGTPSR